MAYNHVGILLPEFEHSFIISLLFANNRHGISVSVSTGNGDAAVCVFHRVGYCKIFKLLYSRVSRNF